MSSLTISFNIRLVVESANPNNSRAALLVMEPFSCIYILIISFRSSFIGFYRLLLIYLLLSDKNKLQILFFFSEICMEHRPPCKHLQYVSGLYQNSQYLLNSTGFWQSWGFCEPPFCFVNKILGFQSFRKRSWIIYLNTIFKNCYLIAFT